MAVRELVLCGSVLVALCAMPVVQADQGGHGLWSVGMTTNGLTARYSASDKDTVFGGANYGKLKDSYNGGSSLTQDSYSVVMGYRHYFNESDVRGFVNASLSYGYTQVAASGSSLVGPAKTKATSVLLAYGLEKSVSESFGVEGAVGVKVSRSYGSGFETTLYSIPVVEVGVDYYFK